jgi:catechol 2,3-dioxygenase-like lactoylglutathione lyase family enzyme
VRLRQICLAAPRLEPAVQTLQDGLGLSVAWRDGNVGKYGLENAVLPIGTSQFLEVVAPTQPDTAVDRFLARAASPGELGAYMLICDCPDPAAARERAKALGIRVITDTRYADYHGVQLHPRDTGAVMIEFNATPGGEDPTGPYHPAGPDWQQHVRLSSGPIDVVRVRAHDPATMAEKWAALFDRPTQPQGEGFVIELDLGRIEILPGAGRPEALYEIALGPALAAAGETAPLPGAPFDALDLCGVRFVAA